MGRQFRSLFARRGSLLPLCVLAAASCTAAMNAPTDDEPAPDDGQVPGVVPVPPGDKDLFKGRTDPGRVVLRRLSKVEYGNTIRDLFGLEGKHAGLFPAEDAALGFDNLGVAQRSSTALVSAHAQAVDAVVADVLANRGGPSAMWKMDCDVGTEGEACAQRLLADLAKKAWRRPAEPADVQRLVAVYKAALAAGAPAPESLGAAMSAALLSPRFLFRLERPAGSAAGIKALDPFEDATRLSYFLWSTTPDHELLDAAASGKLADVEGRRAQIRRMLASPKRAGFVSSFVGQWLLLRRLADHTVDPKVLSGWSDTLAKAMVAETERFFAHAIERGTVPELMLSREAFADGDLASHYGDRTSRQGLLGHASILTVTSHPGSTSPVLRGKFILEQLLCEELPAPPPNVSLLDDVKVEGTLRQRLELHRSNPSCAACHDVIDPLGFGLEAFDAVGRARTQDAGFPIDAAGKLNDGRSFTGPAELIALLAKDPRLPSCLAKKLYVFALGRAVEDEAGHMDPAVLASLEAALTQANGRLDVLFERIADAPTFRAQRFE